MKVELDVIEPARLIKETTSRCPVCRVRTPARVVAAGGKVHLERDCPEHGSRSICISSDERLYRLSVGSRCGADAQKGAGASAGDFSKLSTCLALIEIVDGCNLSCPVCFAESSPSKGVDGISPAEFRRRVESVISRKGEIEILQLSGGEPTIHPRFFELLSWAQEHESIGYVLVNTNGVRFAREPRFAAAFDAAFRRGKVQLYLQYDGPQEGGQATLRGMDLRAVREDALHVTASMGDNGLPVTLAMTVTPENLPHVWGAIAFGLRHPHVRGVSFQPLFQSGRVAGPLRDDPATSRLNTADVILAAVEQSAGRLRLEDFTPLPCGDPNCATIGYLLKLPGGTRSISELIDFENLQGFLRQRVNYDIDDLSRCGCDSEPLGDLLKELELAPEHTFRLFVKPFMDAWTWDEDRIDRCCTHVIRPDGELDSFCRYYSGFPDAWSRAGQPSE